MRAEDFELGELEHLPFGSLSRALMGDSSYQIKRGGSRSLKRRQQVHAVDPPEAPPPPASTSATLPIIFSRRIYGGVPAKCIQICTELWPCFCARHPLPDANTPRHE